jgi:hypothetical protein
MKTTDYSRIETLEELRTARKKLSDTITVSERRFSSRIGSALQIFSLGKIILPLVKKLRSSISGTPFAKS